MDPYQFIGQPFTLNSTITLSGINFQSAAVIGGGLFTVYLTNAYGPGTTNSNVLAQGSFNFPTGPFTYLPYTLNTNVTLGPGTYYLLWSFTDYFLYHGAIRVGSPISSPYGAIPTNFLINGGGTTFAPALDWNNSAGPGTVAFELVGNPGPATVPEPATLLLVGSGLMGIWWRRRR